MARRQPRVRDTKDRILSAAQQVFAERGFSASSVDEIAVRANVTKGAVYYYFTDKADLARDLQRKLWDHLAAAGMEAFDADLSVTENLKRCFGAYLDALLKLSDAQAFLLEGWRVAPLDLSGQSVQDGAAKPVRKLIEQGIASGELAAMDGEAAAQVIVGVFEEATRHILTTGDPGPTLEVVHRLLDGLAVRPIR